MVICFSNKSQNVNKRNTCIYIRVKLLCYVTLVGLVHTLQPMLYRNKCSVFRVVQSVQISDHKSQKMIPYFCGQKVTHEMEVGTQFYET